MRILLVFLTTITLSISGCHLEVGCNAKSREVQNLKVGTATAIITPPIGISMGGYFSAGRKVEGVHDDLYARCLFLKPVKGSALAIVSLDLIGFSRYDLALIKKRIAGNSELKAMLDPENLIVCSTHNHSGPDTLGVFGDGRDERYMANLREKIFLIIQRASQDVRPASLWHGTADGTSLSVNWKSADLDKDIQFLRFVDQKGIILSTLVNFACHPEALGKKNRLITADFPGYLVQWLENHYDGMGIFLNGALGGMVSLHPETFFHKEKSFERAEEAGLMMAVRASDVYFRRSLVDATQISYQKAVVRIPISNESFRMMIKTGKIPVTSENYEDGQLITEIGRVRIGSLSILLVPGEITPGLGSEIKQLFSEQSGGPVMIFGLANDEIGYILPTKDFNLPQYQQERSKSLGPATGNMILAAFQSLAVR